MEQPPQVDLQLESLETAVGGCWPNEGQLHLLNAVLSSGSDAARHANTWWKQLESPVLDQASHRLIPLLHHRLS